MTTRSAPFTRSTSMPLLNDPATGLPVDGEFDFKLRARYYQTGNAEPAAGSVKAAMIVHLVYQ